MTRHSFKTVYWGPDQSTEVVFEPVSILPDKDLITACFVFAVHDGDNVIMSRPERGWGLVGGHREGDETAEECVRREAYEEAAITLGDLTLIGRWATKKKFHSPHNRKYPDRGYQLLFVADVTKIDQFTPQLEIAERAIVPFAQVPHYHHEFDNFVDIFNYVRSTLDAT
jgi:8-oxo-dGTP pyrophosphatase MutT (NUDIX family)